MVSKPPEVKHFDQYSSSGIDANGTLINISDVIQGTSVTGRLGNTITALSMQILFKAVIHPSQTSTNVRTILVLDKQGYNAPTIYDILENAYLASPYTAVAPYRWDYSKRFKILFDNVDDLTQGAFQLRTWNKEVPLNKVMSFIGNSTTFTNQVYILIISSETNVLQLPVFYYTSRLRFVDD